MASLKQIAADVGVSHALVSRVLNNNMGTTRVSPRTREAIILRAKELDYHPNPLAVALKRGRKGVVGIFIHQVGIEGSELSLNFIESAGERLSELRVNCWLQFFKLDSEFRAACNEGLLRKVDGLIVAGVPHPGLVENLRHIEERGLRVVTACHGMRPDSGLVNYQVDHEHQSYLTTRHLLEIGCRRIAHFKVAPERYNGYIRAHAEAGVEPIEELHIPAFQYRADDGYRCMKILVDSGRKYDAVNTQSDAQAAGAMRYLSEIGLHQRLWPKMTGIDDSPIARAYCSIPLTSATSEMALCADLAVTAVMSKLEGGTPVSRDVEPRLVVRQSTVP